mgnify:CR=1 FL=1
MNSINSRFQEVLKSKRLSIKEASIILDMTEPYIRKLTGEGNSFGIEPIKKILISFNDIDARWFLTGERSGSDDNSDSNLIITNRNLSETVKNLSETIKVLSNK